MAFKNFSKNTRRSPPPPSSLSPTRSRPRPRNSSPLSSPIRHQQPMDKIARPNSNSNKFRSRSKSPTPPPSSFHHAEDQRETEAKAKAKRLDRFKTELSYPLRPSSPPLEDGHYLQQQQQGTTPPMGRKEVDDTMDCDDAEPILGSCPYMCPESERGERERKGDLDKFERLHGDRNLTDKLLAVKKYNRTAEREASLIRPLPVLQMTMDHLLNLIDRSYNDDVLSIYNFLWDRMRAIRMDLRIQHIFNKDAITMHEQMIRFHIVAMHELCEYTKGEGFSEGFDAHLNIEQMNKTSVELFQMYDDHRRRGSPIPTEQEFRGYYALLKLDRHPGYKVEPAELSLDLAKMAPEIKNTNEVLFARKLARASRSGNYIAFFRLARKATYLQACLMHAHFAKLRTQALASLHSSLQKNQGIPASQVVKWLDMEGEDFEGLLKHHGFSLKQFEDLYMVKEGPFLNSDIDFHTKRSQLVHQKRSSKVVSDVISSREVPIMDGTLNKIKSLDAYIEKLSNRAQTSPGPVFISTVIPPEEEMPDYEEDGLLNKDEKNNDWEGYEAVGSHQNKNVKEADSVEIRSPSAILGRESASPRLGAAKHTIDWSLQRQQESKKRRTIYELDMEVKRKLHPTKEHFVNLIEKEGERPFVQDINEIQGTEMVKDWIVVEADSQEEESKLAMWKVEADNAKLKLILRRWKRWASRKAESRHVRQLKANAALNSILLGPPVRSIKGISCQEEIVGSTPGFSLLAVDLNIDQLVRERQIRHMRMWSKLDVPEVVAPILSRKNPQATCLCWKLLLCSRTCDKLYTHSNHIVGQWLQTKLMGNDKTDIDGFSVSMSEVAMTKHGSTCGLFCLCITRDIAFNADRVENEESILGASGLMFLLVDDQWNHERTRLQSLVKSVKPGSCLPLLILSSGNVEGSAIENQLELYMLDRTRISCWSVIFVTENEHNIDAKGFLGDECLRKGLQWLADHAPPQPIVYPSDIRELVLESLQPYLNILLSAKPLEVTPNYCIHAFNQALNETEKDIVLAAENSLPGWPSSEIKDLDVRMGYGFLDSYLPKSGWNIDFNIEAIIQALQLCRLPEPSFNLSHFSCASTLQELSSLNLHSENNKLDEIEEQKISFQRCLYQYLCQINFGKKGDSMTLKEADLMVQKHAACEWMGSKYVIVPQWAAIFRRIYNWRLMLLASEPPPIVYVSRPRKVGLLVNELGQQLLSSVRQIFLPSGYMYQVTPSLDDMIESSCKVLTRALRLEPNNHVVKDPFKQHTEDDNPKWVVGNGFPEVVKDSDDQSKFSPGQVPFMDIILPTEDMASQEEFHIPDFDEMQHKIEFGQTDGEVHLSQVVSDFCGKVNEQKQRISMLIEEAYTTDTPAKVNLAVRPYLAEREVSDHEETRSQRCGLERSPLKSTDCRMAISTRTWTNENAMDNLNGLLEQCNAVQRSIDKKLAVYHVEK